MKRALLWTAVSSSSQAAEDKVSLSDQESECRSWATANGYDVVAHLSVPGFSRSESDPLEALAEFRDQGVTAYDELRAHWKAKDFDVLVAYHHNRLGRSSTLHSYVVENVILSGARIYLILGGWIDASGFRFQIAMGGAQSAGEIDQLKARYQMGMDGRLMRDLSGAHPPFSHIIVGSNGDKRLELDTAKEAFWRDLAELLLSGVKFNDLGAAMAARGHRQKTGKPYANHTLWRHLHSPFTYGHVARHFERKHGAWAFDESEPLPEGVKVRRDVIPPVYSGELGERVKAELRRRSDNATGKASSEHTHRYSGLLVCAECGYRLGYSDGRYCCTTRWTRRADVQGCSNIAYISERSVDETMLGYLHACLESGDVKSIWEQTHEERPEDFVRRRIDELGRQAAAAEERLREMIRLQATETQGVVHRIRAEEITRLGEQIEEITLEIARLDRMLEPGSIRRQREVAFEALRTKLPEGILASPDREVNQFLYALMGNLKFVVREGQIVDVGQKKVRPGR